MGSSALAGRQRGGSAPGLQLHASPNCKPACSCPAFTAQRALHDANAAAASPRNAAAPCGLRAPTAVPAVSAPPQELKVAMRALGFEPKKEEIKKMIADIDKVRGRPQRTQCAHHPAHHLCFETRPFCPAAPSPCCAACAVLLGAVYGGWLAPRCTCKRAFDWLTPPPTPPPCRTAAAPSTSRSSCR